MRNWSRRAARAMWLGAIIVPLALGCRSARPLQRDDNEAAMFGPSAMRLHPTFTQFKDWNNDKKPDGIDAVVEFQDQFGDPTRAAGKIIFELYEYRPHYADPRGPRLANPWIATLATRQEQQSRWSAALRAYSFELEFPTISASKTYVLQATFERDGARLFDQLIVGPS